MVRRPSQSSEQQILVLLRGKPVLMTIKVIVMLLEVCIECTQAKQAIYLTHMLVIPPLKEELSSSPVYQSFHNLLLSESLL